MRKVRALWSVSSRSLRHQTPPLLSYSSLGVCDAVLFCFSSSSHATFCFCGLYFPSSLCISVAHARVLGPLFFIPPAALSWADVCLQDTLNDARTLEAPPSQPIIPQWKTRPSDTPNATLEHMFFPYPPLPTLRLYLPLNPQCIFKKFVWTAHMAQGPISLRSHLLTRYHYPNFAVETGPAWGPATPSRVTWHD